MQPARAFSCVENFKDLPFLFETGHFPEENGYGLLGKIPVLDSRQM